MEFIGTLALILFLTLFVGHYSQRMGVPGVIGQLLVGVVLGPAILNWIHLNSLVQVFSDLGVIILMFIAGLESNIALLKKYLRPALIVAVIGVIFPVVIMGASGLLFHFSRLECFFLGVVFSATSVSISVEVLKEFHALDTKEGATILGAAVADDIIGVILLSILVSMMGESSGNQNLLIVILKQILYFVGVYLLIKWIAPYLMRTADHLFMTASRTIMSMIICLAMAWLAELVGLSGAVGAFFAGIAVAMTPAHEEIGESVEPIGYAIFIPMFFVSVGLNMNFSHLWQSLGFVVLMTVLGIGTKLIGCGLGGKLSGFDLTSNYVIGAGMISRGEMALITAQIGFSAKLMGPTHYSDVILVIILVTIIAPFILKHAITRQQNLATE
ncbi:cation:proton antiporter [Pediococcus ethanolidurans]|uniref:cation:proton antiporter n=1 Tax=Pediococcus ethanolidurans TaxID=319653 RepID=UPI001C1E9E4C|nr:cation:proton antiporter [Pediococcus ethanolidurans]MBU7555149.1 cation:proton antiporter [Pediococcus ethanolidurans]MBU7563763.1 cation:proton antiporter [Pediococcus ethanolidurans]MCT4398651.1 cation:proton antiporter [Pediococcus ethanolidurans]MCV3316255.1 cation:proton antiporter [Pediococcus ethanolidurans]MCV3321575.1 cation:proton antiporter [Pediococcus ethanolidurans]